MNPVHYSFERPLLSIPIFTAPFGPHQRLPSLPNNHSPLLQATFTLPALSIFQGTRGWGKERLTLSFPSLDAFTIIIIFVLVTAEQMVVVWEHHKLCPYKIADSVNICVFWLPCQAAILYLSLFSGLLAPWDKITLEWGQLITLQWPLSMQVKGRVSRCSL